MSWNTEQIITQMHDFFTLPDAGWSFVTIPFMVAFLVFYFFHIFISRSRRWLMMTYVTAFSLFFAYKANGVLMLLLPATVITSWLLTRQMERTRTRWKRRAWLTVIILTDLAPLVYYKYTNFFIDIWNELMRDNFAPLSLLLPVGISFYTFQAISYSVDAYRKTTSDRLRGEESHPQSSPWERDGEGFASPSLLEYTFFLTFFPLLMAGPITRAGTLIPQLRHRRGKSAAEKERWRTLVNTGLWLIIVGLMKKMVIADYLAQYNNWIFDDPMSFSGFENMMGIIGYTLQIYCDFSGYSDLSIGLAALMGIRLKDNFRFPYQSTSLTEFWHRWHISLSTWFRDYLYIPLGGSRHGTFLTCLNLIAVMLVAGLWHGASWMFLIWGSIHGVGLVANKLFRRLKPSSSPPKVNAAESVSPPRGIRGGLRLLSWLLTFLYVAAAWVFFRSTSVDMAVTILTHAVTDFNPDYILPFVATRPIWSALLLAGFLLHALRERHVERLKLAFIRSPWTLKLIVFAVIMQLVINFSQNNVQPFIYAQF